MQQNVQKKVCLLMNIGGFEHKQEQHLERAFRYGEAVLSLSINGIADSNVPPANVLEMDNEQLIHWSEMINIELYERGFHIDEVVILAGGRNSTGILPLGMIIKNGISLGVGIAS